MKTYKGAEKMVKREDVAKRAGVSVSAVSRTINKRGYVSPSNKEKIWKAIEELGYTSRAITEIKARKTNQLCLLFNQDIRNNYCVELYEYMRHAAASRGQILFMAKGIAVESLPMMAMDGCIVENDDVARKIQEQLGDKLPFPIVSVSYGLPTIQTKKIPYINTDGYKAMEMSVRYLIRNGHRKIAHATIRPFATGEIIQPRTIAFQRMLETEFAQADPKKYLIIPWRSEAVDLQASNSSFFETGMKAADEFIRMDSDATAIICFNDDYALGMIARFRHLGYDVPGDISVMGIDGLVAGMLSNPRLTTVSMNLQKQAEESIDILLSMIEGKKVPHLLSIKPEILEGETVKKLN